MSTSRQIFQPRFLCDAMLARLARYLRAAGYDTVLAQGHERDAELVSLAVNEDRWLLTLDRQILEHKAGAGRVCLLEHGSVEEHAQQLALKFDLDWQAKPFSRCLVDNAQLEPAMPEQVMPVPPHIRASETRFMACPDCGRVYWAGSHHRRMQATLESWSSTPK